MHKRIRPTQQTTEIKIEDYLVNEDVEIFNKLDKKDKIKILLISGLALFIGTIKLIIRNIKR